jgi:hypothetical protein
MYHVHCQQGGGTLLTRELSVDHDFTSNEPGAETRQRLVGIINAGDEFSTRERKPQATWPLTSGENIQKGSVAQERYIRRREPGGEVNGRRLDHFPPSPPFFFLPF